MGNDDVNSRERLTPLRDEAMFVYYLEVMRRKGERARFMDKSEIYREVAEPFFCTSHTVGRVVTHKLKKNNTISDEIKQRLIDNVETALNALRKVRGNKKRE